MHLVPLQNELTALLNDVSQTVHCIAMMLIALRAIQKSLRDDILIEK